MSKKHNPEMIAAWARENGVFGYEHYDLNIEKAKEENLLKRKDLTKP